MTPSDWDREPTSDAERVRWRVAAHAAWVIETVEGGQVAAFVSEGAAAEAVWAHNVMCAAREQRALGVGAAGAKDPTTEGAQ